MKIDPANDEADVERTTDADEVDVTVDAAGATGTGERSDAGSETEAEPGTDERTAGVVGGDDSADEDDDVADDAEPLTIGLPDGTESVSEAILSHRRMLTNPSDHGLVSADDAEQVIETLEELANDVPDDLRGDLEGIEASVDDMAARLDRQERQIRELRDTVASLADILGASVDFEDGDENGS